jgi:hypothetical protein
VSCCDVIQVFKNALLDQSLIAEAKQQVCIVGSKRSQPGDLVVAENGWDAVKLPKSTSTANPAISVAGRRKKTLLKSQRS